MAKSFYTTGAGNEQTLTPIMNEKIPIYDDITDAEADLSNLAEGQIIGTKDTDLVANLAPVDEVKDGVFKPVTSNAVAECLKYSSAETFTGEIWIDENNTPHKVYRKTKYINANYPSSITFGLSSGDEIIDYKMKMGWADSSTVSVIGEVTYRNGTGMTPLYVLAADKITLSAIVSDTIYIYWAVIKYIKATE